jgi:hypothetical protein
MSGFPAPVSGLSKASTTTCPHLFDLRRHVKRQTVLGEL